MTHNKQLSFYDIVIDRNAPQQGLPPPVVSAPKTAQTQSDTAAVLCPYKIPTVDEIIKQIENSAYKVNKSKFIADVLECGAIALSNTIDLPQAEKREERYKQIMKSYQPKEREWIAEIFGKIFALLSSVVYDNGVFNDYLGELFMRCNQGEKNAGQYFTPYHVSRLMAEMAVTEDKIKDGKILTVSDCCCGGGGMLLAVLDVLKNRYKVNYARDCFIHAGDVDARCVHMTYLQLSLAGVPAIVKHQDALSCELWGVWKTPAYLFQYPRFYKYAK